MTRSIPEKTLEHWVSMYVTYRYRSHARLWWPTRGEDVNVGDLPVGHGGKAFKLEIKSAEPRTTAGVHDVEIDVRQLQRYMLSPIPTYYVLPHPFWDGSLPPSPELGYRRSGGSWFGNWMCVIPDHVLYAPLRSRYPLTSVEPLPTYERVYSTAGFPWTAVPGPAFGSWPFFAGVSIPWVSFWDAMDVCGSAFLPSVLAIPSNRPGLAGLRPGPLQRSALVDILTQRIDEQTLVQEGGDQNEGVTYFVPANRQNTLVEEDFYVRYQPGELSAEGAGDAEDNNRDAHSTLVSIDAETISAARR